MKTILNQLFHRQFYSRLPRLGSISIIVVAAALLIVITAHAVTILSIAGYADYYFGVDISAKPTDGRPETKIWWNDGSWWGNLYNPTTLEYQIYKLNWNTQTWTTTGTTTDVREDSRADALWDETSSKLYIASHVKLENPSQVANPANWARLYRYSYNTTTDIYTLDAGFEDNALAPAYINQDKTRTLVLDKDSTNRLWAAYVSKKTNLPPAPPNPYKVYVNFTTTAGNDASWDIPYELPFPEATVDQDALASVVAFHDDGGSKIGVLWSNELDGKFYFATRLNSALPGDLSSWTLETGLTNVVPVGANDHLDIVKGRNDQMFFAIKSTATGVGQPLIALIARDHDGTYSFHPVAPVESNDTRPIVVYYDATGSAGDERVYVFMVSDPAGGVACYLSAQVVSPLANLSFTPRSCGDPGLAGATRIIADSTKYFTINNVTSARQILSSTTDILVLASDDVENTYVHSVVNKPLPYVTQAIPINGSNVPILSVFIRATFSKDMDSGTINASNFTLKNSSNQSVAGTVTYNPSNRSVSFTPNALLTNGETYTLTLMPGIKDQLGQPLLNSPYSWSFTASDRVKFYLPVTLR
jgi:hypothetical protein